MSPANSIFPLFLTKKGPTAGAIREVLQRIGEATAGTKDVIQTRLLTGVYQNKLPVPLKDKPSQRVRILSIDMGIKNLAYCIADVERPTFTIGAAKMNFHVWRRMDIGEAFREYTLGGDQKNPAEETATESQQDEDLFSPESLSRMAYWFLNRILLDFEPDIILIERQRWRSAGSPAIQQWTVRVNTLEANMWAVMTTLKNERGKLSDRAMYAVDPKRVGHFWLSDVTYTPAPSQKRKSKVAEPLIDHGGDEHGRDEIANDEAGTKKLSRSKAEKRAKIQLLRTWLNSDNPSTALYLSNKGTATDRIHTEINFSFEKGSLTPAASSHSADDTRQALLYATDKPSERARRTVHDKSYVKKVDDLTDCFLQAAAWVAWGENLRLLGPQVDAFREQVEEKLGRKIDWPPKQLAEAMKELQDDGKLTAKEGQLDEKEPKKTRTGKTTKTPKSTDNEDTDGEAPA